MNKVDVIFPIGNSREYLPLEHGYQLFSSICKYVPGLHDDRDVFISRVSGKYDSRCIITTKHSALRIRLPTDKVGSLVPLIGRVLEIESVPLYLCQPYIEELKPLDRLYCPMVLFKFTKPGNIAKDFNRVLGERTGKYRGEFTALNPRQFLFIRGNYVYTYQGYDVLAVGLSDKDSVELQEQGLGAKQHMGCGIFGAARGSVAGKSREALERQVSS
jgi:CRISPR-associated protein Cas6